MLHVVLEICEFSKEKGGKKLKVKSFCVSYLTLGLMSGIYCLSKLLRIF
jgi:hypothetical protein